MTFRDNVRAKTGDIQMKIENKKTIAVTFALVSVAALAITAVAIAQVLNNQYKLTTFKLPAFITNLSTRDAAIIAGVLGGTAIVLAVTSGLLLKHKQKAPAVGQQAPTLIDGAVATLSMVAGAAGAAGQVLAGAAGAAGDAAISASGTLLAAGGKAARRLAKGTYKVSARAMNSIMAYLAKAEAAKTSQDADPELKAALKAIHEAECIIVEHSDVETEN